MSDVRVLPTSRHLVDRIAELEAEIRTMRARLPMERAALLVVSSKSEKVQAAMMLAHAAAEFGLDTSVYFANRGVQVLRRRPRADRWSRFDQYWRRLSEPPAGRPPPRSRCVRTIARVCRKIFDSTANELLEAAPYSGIRLMACPASLERFDLRREVLRPHIEICKAPSFVDEAYRSQFFSVF